MDAGRARLSARLERDPTCRMVSIGSRSPRRSAWRSISAMVNRRRSFIARSKAGNTGSRDAHRMARVTGFARSAFFEAVAPLLPKDMVPIPCCEGDKQRCRGGADATIVEECYWKTLSIIRRSMEASRPMVEALAAHLRTAQERLNARARKPSDGRPLIDLTYTHRGRRWRGAPAPPELTLKPGTKTTLREQLGRVLNYYNVATDGGFRCCCGRSARIDKYQQSERKVSERFLQSPHESRRARARHRRNLRGRHDGDAVRHQRIWRSHRRGLILRRVQRTARAHSRAAPRDWQSGTRRNRRRRVSSVLSCLRTRRIENRRGWSNPCRPAVIAVAPG